MHMKRAFIALELVDESVAENSERISRELLEWFREGAVCIPWVKEVKEVSVKD
jgi:hypothetical protein